ncbi:hypothetical protein LXL04_026743 [Taraxacum kok-saghyz]
MVFRYCGRVAIVRTSWTDTNPGRRFRCCTKQVSRCAFFSWIDPPMRARSAKIIPGLLRNINNGEGLIKNLNEEIAKWKMMMLASWVLFLLVFFCILLG